MPCTYMPCMYVLHKNVMNARMNACDACKRIFHAACASCMSCIPCMYVWNVCMFDTYVCMYVCMYVCLHALHTCDKCMECMYCMYECIACACIDISSRLAVAATHRYHSPYSITDSLTQSITLSLSL